MNNLASHYAMARNPHRQNHLSDFKAAGYAKEQTVKSHESLETDLVIKTKEGDQVTLSTNSFSAMDGYTYDSKGIVHSAKGSAAFSENVRQISLASGESFSFTVKGDLSEAELEDIEELLQDLDGVMSEMIQGDMSGAMNKVMDMGGYDTFSSYSADLNYQMSYEMRSSEAAVTREGALPAQDSDDGPRSRSFTPDEFATRPGHRRHQRAGFGDFGNFFKRMENQLANHEKNQVVRAKQPINNLFQHHLDTIDKIGDEVDSVFTTVETAMDKIDSLIGKMMQNLFGEEMAEAVEDED